MKYNPSGPTALLSATGLPVHKGQLVAYSRKHTTGKGMTLGVVKTDPSPAGNVTIEFPITPNYLSEDRAIPCYNLVQVDPATVNWDVLMSPGERDLLLSKVS